MLLCMRVLTSGLHSSDLIPARDELGSIDTVLRRSAKAPSGGAAVDAVLRERRPSQKS